MSDETQYEYRVVEYPERGGARVALTCPDEGVARDHAERRRGAQGVREVRVERRERPQAPPWMPVPERAPDRLPGV